MNMPEKETEIKKIDNLKKQKVDGKKLKGVGMRTIDMEAAVKFSKTNRNSHGS